MIIIFKRCIVLFIFLAMIGFVVSGDALSQTPRQWPVAEAKLIKLQDKPKRMSSDLIRMVKQHQSIRSGMTTSSTEEDPMKRWIKQVEGLPELEICLQSSDPANVKMAKQFLIDTGMTVTSVSQKYGRIYGTIDISKIEALNNTPYLSMVHPNYLPINRMGSVESEGDAAMDTRILRDIYSVDGAGVTIGIMSDSFDASQSGFDAVITNGDLPGAGNANGYTTPVDILLDDTDPDNIDEGRAMAEIIHDVAPGAALAFHTAFLGSAGMAEAFATLKNYGADIIVDDVSYLTEPCFQDGIVAQAAQAAVDEGVLLFSSAGNAANHAIEMPYKDIDPVHDDEIYGMGKDLHDFGKGNPFARIVIPPGKQFRATLWWNEPYDGTLGPGASTDLDLYLFDADSEKVVGYSTTSQGCSLGDGVKGGDPYEFLGYYNSTKETVTLHFVVDRVCGSGENLTFKIMVFGNIGIEFDESLFNASTTFGHPATEGVIAVGAVDYAETDAFNDPPNDPILVEFFSSLGHKIAIFFDENGHELDNAPVIRSKPEIAAPDGVSTSTPFFEHFYGTSAASPHAGAMAALLLEAAPPGLNDPVLITDCMRGGAIDVGMPRWDGYSGNGLINGPNAMALLMGGGRGVYAIQAGSGGHGSIYPSGRMIGYTPSSGETMAAHDMTFTFHPEPHYHVADILINGESQGAPASYTFADATEDQTIHAEFAPDRFTIAASAGTGGSIDPSGNIPVTYADNQKFVITAEPGYRLTDVIVDGESMGALGSMTFSDTIHDQTIAAIFSINTYSITTSIEGQGSIEPADDQIVPYGSNLIYTVRADEGHHIRQILVNNLPTGDVDTGVFTLYLSHIAEPTMIRTDFAVNTYLLSPVASEHCTITPSTPQTVTHGQSMTFNIQPETGYRIKDVLVDGISVGTTATYVFNNTAADHGLVVEVEKAPTQTSASGRYCFISSLQ